MKPLVLDDEADGEYRHAVGVYTAENLAVAVRFSEHVEEALTRIAAEPHIWPLASGVRERLGVRKYRIDRFPTSTARRTATRTRCSATCQSGARTST